MSRYITCAETAKLVRLALVKNFPSYKFSVRSKTYSGGASIDVSWTDGPTTEAVDKIVGVFEGARFDPMCDLKYGAEHYLASDGTAQIRRTYGHSYDTDQITPPPPNTEIVEFGSDYVHTNRHLSVAFLHQAAVTVCGRYGLDPLPEIVQSGNSAYIGVDMRRIGGMSGRFLQDEIYRETRIMTA